MNYKIKNTHIISSWASLAVLTIIFFHSSFLQPTLASAAKQSTNSEKEQEGEYYFFYSTNHYAEQAFVSNVFFCDVYPNDLDCSKYIENELDYDLESYEDTFLISHREKSYVYDSRNDQITWVKDNKYKLIRFKIYCDEDGKIYPKD